MNEVDEAFLARRESLLDRIDYAIGIVQNIIEHPSLINLNAHNLENIKKMLMDIEKEVRVL